MIDYVLREFVCKHCGHKVVVNPKLPLDYMPTTCTPCFEAIVVPRAERNAVKLAQAAKILLDALAGRAPTP